MPSRIMLLIPKVLGHGVQGSLEHVLGQLVQQPARTDQLDVLLLGLLQELLSKLLLINDICSHRPDHRLLIGWVD
jgi:hypothetical protein